MIYIKSETTHEQTQLSREDGVRHSKLLASLRPGGMFVKVTHLHCGAVKHVVTAFAIAPACWDARPIDSTVALWLAHLADERADVAASAINTLTELGHERANKVSCEFIARLVNVAGDATVEKK